MIVGLESALSKYLILKAFSQYIDQNGPVITKDYDQAFRLLVFLINGVMTIGGGDMTAKTKYTATRSNWPGRLTAN